MTCAVRERRKILDQPSAHAAIVEAWRMAEAWHVGKYMIMPDHIHLFCSPAGEIPLATWMRYWKRLAAQTCPELLGRWQPGHWDTRIRRTEGYRAKWEYVEQNPVRAGLAIQPEDWPYQGEINVLRID